MHKVLWVGIIAAFIGFLAGAAVNKDFIEDDCVKLGTFKGFEGRIYNCDLVAVKAAGTTYFVLPEAEDGEQ